MNMIKYVLCSVLAAVFICNAYSFNCQKCRGAVDLQVVSVSMDSLEDYAGVCLKDPIKWEQPVSIICKYTCTNCNKAGRVELKDLKKEDLLKLVEKDDLDSFFTDVETWLQNVSLLPTSYRVILNLLKNLTDDSSVEIDVLREDITQTDVTAFFAVILNHLRQEKKLSAKYQVVLELCKKLLPKLPQSA